MIDDLMIGHRAVMASVKLGSWMSAALDDPNTCEAMKADIREWFSAGDECSRLTDRIKALTAENERLREALGWLAKLSEFLNDEPSCMEELQDYVQLIARAALSGKDEQ